MLTEELKSDTFLSDAIKQRLDLLRCPSCYSSLELDRHLYCRNCHQEYYNETHGIISFLPKSLSMAKQKIQAFWGDTCKQWYEGDNIQYTVDSLQKDLILLEDLFRRRDHLVTNEMDLSLCAGKEILEVGSGGGGHSALFRKHGAHMTSVDITPERAASTMGKLHLLRNIPMGSGLALQADAERLPFKENAFDIVYSNGVIMCSENTERCAQEIFRVLKPGGQAIIMIYARHSALFWLKMLPYAVASGLFFKLPEHLWLGQITEGRPKYQQERNPITRVYSKRQLLKLFEQFKVLSLRKHSFTFAHLPIPKATLLRDKILSFLGHAPPLGSRIVYGDPIIPETTVEMWLSKIMGFCWNIKAVKNT